MMGSSMYGYGIWGLLLNILIVLLVVWVTITLLNRSGSEGFGSSANNERIARVEKDVEEIKKMVQDIKDKLDEI